LHKSLKFLVALCVVSVGQAQSSQASLEAKVLGQQDADASPISTDAIDTEIPELSDQAEPEIDRSDVRDIEQAIEGPKEVPRDHILVVQRRFIKKENRHEVVPLMVGVQPADSFRRQLQWGGGYVYHFSESLGLEAAHVSLLANHSTALADDLYNSTGLNTDRIEPVLTLGSSLQWTPLRSKAAALESIFHFEGFFLAGGGLTRVEDKWVGMAMGGLGFRLYMSRSSIVKTEFRNYMDFRDSIEHRFNVLVGVSLLFGEGG
jgi:outer membrane beta-barrel protein